MSAFARLRKRATVLGYAAGWRLVRLLPRPVAFGGFRLVADVMWRRRGRLVQRYERNLRPLLPAGATDLEVRAISRAGLRSYLRYWCEAFRLPGGGDLAKVSRRVVVEHEERLWQAFAATAAGPARGVVAALPHMANWDLAGAWATSVGLRVTAVAERLEPVEVFDRFVRYREALGMQIIALTGGADPFPQLVRSIDAGRLVCLVADRDLTSSGVDVALARGRTRMPPGPAALALRTGAPLVPVTLTYDGPRMRVHVHEPIQPPAGLTGRAAVAEMTQRLAAVFGRALQAQPQDWHMLQRFWLDDPATADRPETRGAAAAGAAASGG